MRSVEDRAVGEPAGVFDFDSVVDIRAIARAFGDDFEKETGREAADTLSSGLGVDESLLRVAFRLRQTLREGVHVFFSVVDADSGLVADEDIAESSDKRIEVDIVAVGAHFIEVGEDFRALRDAVMEGLFGGGEVESRGDAVDACYLSQRVGLILLSDSRFDELGDYCSHGYRGRVGRSRRSVGSMGRGRQAKSSESCGAEFEESVHGKRLFTNDFKEFNVEDESSVRAYDATGAVRAVGEVGGDVEAPTRARFHELKSFDPARDNLSDAESSGNAPFFGRVEYSAVDKFAGVVHFDLVVGRRLSAVAVLDDFVLEAGSGCEDFGTFGVFSEEILARFSVDIGELGSFLFLSGFHFGEEFADYDFSFVVGHFGFSAGEHGGHAIGEIVYIDVVDARSFEIVAHAQAEGVGNLI